MLTLHDLTKVREQTRVLDRANLTVERGEVAVLVGPSGGGKSTLLRCINGFETFQQGSIRVAGVALDSGQHSAQQRTALKQLREKVGMVFQQFNLFPHMNALENVMSGPRFAQGKSYAEAQRLAEPLLERVGLAHKQQARPEEMSGGEQQRVAIARALAVKPEVMLFDEPTSALDPKNAGEVLDVIGELAASGLTMLVVTHALAFARKVARSLHVMHAGRILESGPPEQLFTSPRHAETKQFLAQGQ